LLLVVLIVLSAVLALLPISAQAWGWYHRREAQKALKLARIPEAQAHVEQCLRVWPNSFEIHLLAAQLARRQDDFQEAERHLSRCQEIRGGIPEEVVLEQSLIQAQRGGMDAMMSYLKPLVEQGHPATPLILEAMARGYMRAYRFGDAAAVLHEWVARCPDDIQALLSRGWVREQDGPQEGAVADYKRVVELDPENDEGRLRLAALLTERAAPAEALPHLEYVARKRQNDPAVLVRLARCYMDLGRHQEPAEILDRVLAEHPNFRLALGVRGELALQLDRPQEAEKYFREALVHDPADALTQFNLCKSLRQQGKDDEAQAAEQRLKVMETDIVRIHDILKNELGKAPNDPPLLTEIGTILLRAGSHREGVHWLYRALEHDPGYRPAHQALADHYERLGQTQQALRHRRFLGVTEEVPPPAGSRSEAEPRGNSSSLAGK
jgi:tetratricopeptide (TPR) repeat protein